MALSEKEQKILNTAKEKLRIINQVSKLEKEISSLGNKLEIKEAKLSELIAMLSDDNSSRGQNSDSQVEKNDDLFNENVIKKENK